MKIRVLGIPRDFSLTRIEMDAICTNGYKGNRTTFDNEIYTFGVKLVKDVEHLYHNLRTITTCFSY